jgi:ubiquinone/menaquinone biosynthesis C-methylase UbiE
MEKTERELHYSKRKRHYQNEAVASSYDQIRFTGRKEGRNRRKIAAIEKAMRRIGDPGMVLDIPAGTGRFFEYMKSRGLKFAGADISHEMLAEARKKVPEGAVFGLVVADAEKMPLKDGAVDVVMSIRFLFHVPGDMRIKIIGEMARVAKRYLILDYRLLFSVVNIKRLILSKLRLQAPPKGKVTKKQMLAELKAAGVEPVAIFPVTRVWSDKYIVLCRVPEKKAQS